MKCIDFNERNTLIAEHQEEYQTIPAFIDKELGVSTFLWKPTFIERVKILFGANLWHSVMTFNQPLQPQLLRLEYPFEEE